MKKIQLGSFKWLIACLMLFGLTDCAMGGNMVDHSMSNDTNEVSPSNDTHMVVNTITQVPIPTLKKTIDLSDIGSPMLVKKLTYSPDGRFLAIVIDPMVGNTDIVVWDLQRDIKQSHIHCQGTFSVQNYDDPLWSMDGKIISFGAKRQWNPITGEALPDNSAIGRAARLNKDGSKMLTIVDGPDFKSHIYIYDTRTWEQKKIDVDGLRVESAAWTAEDKIIVGTYPSGMMSKMIGRTLDGHTIKPYDVAIRLIAPSGNQQTKALWFDSVPDDRPNYIPLKQSMNVHLSVSNFATNQIALGEGQIINGKTMDILTYYAVEDMENHNNKVSTGVGGVAFSPDGKYLFIKAGEWFDRRKPVVNSIIDTATGKQLAQFGEGNKGIAISPNGQQLAIGNNTSVQIFSLK